MLILSGLWCKGASYRRQECTSDVCGGWLVFQQPGRACDARQTQRTVCRHSDGADLWGWDIWNDLIGWKWNLQDGFHCLLRSLSGRKAGSYPCFRWKKAGYDKRLRLWFSACTAYGADPSNKGDSCGGSIYLPCGRDHRGFWAGSGRKGKDQDRCSKRTDSFPGLFWDPWWKGKLYRHDVCSSEGHCDFSRRPLCAWSIVYFPWIPLYPCYRHRRCP